MKLARAHGQRGSERFVNAVLRSICRHPETPALPSKSGDPLLYLTITLSHPEWLAHRYLSRLGLEGAEARCRRHNRPPPTYLRIEPPFCVKDVQEALARESVISEPFPLVPRCLRVQSGKPTMSSLHRSGAVFIQEAGSQLLPYLLRIPTGDPILDACAAPGGKATEMSHWSHPRPVIALERRPRRLALLRSLAKHLGCDNLLPVGADAGRMPFRKPFRSIFLDVPCSSLGTLARNPDIKWRLREKDLAVHSVNQRHLLASCAGILAPGGQMVYATCSTEPEENEEVVSDFLEHHPHFRITTPPPSFPEAARKLISHDGALRTHPERDGMDGYYAAILEKR